MAFAKEREGGFSGVLYYVRVYLRVDGEGGGKKTEEEDEDEQISLRDQMEGAAREGRGEGGKGVDPEPSRWQQFSG